jgi:hypothetical protein
MLVGDRFPRHVIVMPEIAIRKRRTDSAFADFRTRRDTLTTRFRRAADRTRLEWRDGTAAIVAC